MRAARISTLVLALTVWGLPVWSAPGGGGGHGGGGHGGGGGRAGGGGRSSAGFAYSGGAGRMSSAPPGAVSGVPEGRFHHFLPPNPPSTVVTPPPSPPPAAAINPGFPTAFGNTVGQPAFPPVVFPPGVGNINQPGLPPGAPPAIPNINNPGAPFFGGRFNVFGGVPGNPFPFRGRRGFPGAYFGFPFYGFGFSPFQFGVPYTYFPFLGYNDFSYYPGYAPNVPPSDAYPEQPSYSEIGPPADSTLPQTFVVQPEMEQQPPQAAGTTPEARPVTLLAFKDHTIVAVTDYWLEGDTLYYESSYGAKTGIPLSQLDLAFTQQLNRERNLRFVLESR